MTRDIKYNKVRWLYRHTGSERQEVSYLDKDKDNNNDTDTFLLHDQTPVSCIKYGVFYQV